MLKHYFMKTYNLLRIAHLAALALIPGALAAPALYDNFAPAADNTLTGAWQKVRGDWEPTLLILNPAWAFRAINTHAYQAKPNPDGLCLTGAADWDNYRFAIAIEAEPKAVTGMVLRYVDEGNQLQVRLSFPARPEALNGRLTVTRNVKGKAQLLATRDLELAIGQWYRLQTSLSGPFIRVSLDDQVLVNLRDPAPGPGRAGLIASGAPALFDDAEIQPALWFFDNFNPPGQTWKPAQGNWVQSRSDSGPPFMQVQSAGQVQADAAGDSGPQYEVSTEVRLGEAYLAGPAVAWNDAQGKPIGRWALFLQKNGVDAELLLQENNGTRTRLHHPLKDKLPTAAWQTLSLCVRPNYLQAKLGGRVIFEQFDGDFFPGRAGLAGAGAGAAFRRFEVLPREVAPAPRMPETMINDPEMKHQWAHPAWSFITTVMYPNYPKAIPLPWNKGVFFRDFAIDLTVKNLTEAGGKLTFILHGNGIDDRSGYQLILNKPAKNPRVNLFLRFQGMTLNYQTAEVAGESTVIRIERLGGFLIARLNGKPALVQLLE